MKNLLKSTQIRFYLKVGAVYLFFGLFSNFVSKSDSILFWSVNETWHAIYILIMNFLLFEYTIPELSRKKIIRSCTLLATQFFLFSVGSYIWRNFGIQLQIYTEFVTYTSHLRGIGVQLGSSIFSIFFFGIIKHIYDYRKLKETAQLLRIEKQEAELNYLKSQTNPHFLFNTLNNIYSLAKDKSDLAPESILRLSKILRFMLYETNVEYINIEKELKIISDYIELEKLRYDDSLRINLNHNIEDMNQAIPPLLLVPLVENAFKHGVSETRSNPFIDIHIQVKSGQLTFVVKNSIENTSDSKISNEKIGLTNLRRQLELIYSDYNLALEKRNQEFIAKLKINLISHA